MELNARVIRIEESKGLNSRVVFLSSKVVQVMNDLPRNSEFVFTYKNKPLDWKYCLHRLGKLGKQGGIHVTPHQLRHTCATMLLNAGMPILSVQRILGHKYVETTLRYARVYDSTVVKDFQRANSRR